MKCLVTGATGFVGRAVCARLRAQGVTVLPISRSGADLPDGTATRALSLGEAPVPAGWLAGVDVVLHLAGVAHQRAAADQYQRINVAGTRTLAEAAISAGVGRFIYCSSVKAMGPPDGPEPRDESALTPPVDAYGCSKREAEELLQTLCHPADIDLLILRPALVYGPAVRGNLRLMIQAARRGMPRLPARGARSMISVDDLARLFTQLVLSAPPGSHTWLVADGEQYSVRRIQDALRGAMGRGVASGWLPDAAWLLACGLGDVVRRGNVEPLRAKLFGSELYDAGALTLATGWQPRQRLEDVAGQMVQNA